MHKKLACYVIFLLLLAPAISTPAGSGLSYRNPEQINDFLIKIGKQYGEIASVKQLARTPGGRDLLALELTAGKKKKPAILIVANMEGAYPLASEAALELANMLTGEWKNLLDRYSWYIIPVGNPDGYSHYFIKPINYDTRNARPFNDDKDDKTDKDGPEDLNGDGYITRIRQVHPEGEWIPVKDRPYMKKADASKGEKGIYRIFSEGIDNDGDGLINEDGPGGVNPGRNFPHNFEHFTNTNGLWAASEVESRAILRYAFDHPNISMVLVFGTTNTLKNVPTGGRRAEASQDKYKIPERFATRMGLDPNIEYPIKDLLEMAREFTGYKDLTEDMLLSFLGVGAAVNPHQRDLSCWNEISKRYNDFIKEIKLDGKRLAPADSPPGSVEEWAYYQFGVPAFSIDFWTLPVKEKKKAADEGITPDELEKMTNEEFLALGKDKIDEMLKKANTPPNVNADMIMNALKSGMMTTKRMAEMMRNMQKDETDEGVSPEIVALYEYNKDVFPEWKTFDHPTLGKVEIGCLFPYSNVAPDPATGLDLIKKQLPFIKNLADYLPSVSIDKIETKRISSGIYKIDAWIINNGLIPFPTYQGMKCQRPTPAWVSIEGKDLEILEGMKRVVTGQLEGSGGYKKISWLISSKDGSKIIVKLDSFSAGSDTKTISLTAGGAK